MTKKEFLELVEKMGKKTDIDPNEAVKKFLESTGGGKTPIENAIPKKGRRKWKE